MTRNIRTNSYKGSSIELIRAFFAEHAGTLNAQRLVEKKGLSRIRNGKLGSQGSQTARKDLPTPSLSGVTLLNWHKADKVSVHAGTNITQMRLNSGFSKPNLVRGRAFAKHMDTKDLKFTFFTSSLALRSSLPSFLCRVERQKGSSFNKSQADSQMR